MINLTGYTQTELEAFAENIGEQKFRGRQLFSWIYAKWAVDFDEMTDLGKPLRLKLHNQARIGHLTLAEKKVSPDSGSIKYLFRLEDGSLVESVYIPEAQRRTLCISSQVGCALKCAFCATGTLGLSRNLTAGEIVDQVIYAERDAGLQMTNIVFMGMGEPFKNYDAVLRACGLIKHENGLAIGFRRIVLSTVGIVPAIYRYADEGHRYRLAISLHSAINEKRQRIIPVSRKYTVELLMDAVRYYATKSRRRPTIEYVLLAGFNDSLEDATALRELLQDFPCKINLIPYNPTVDAFARPAPAQVDQFATWLLPLKAPISVRWSKGADIEAACGQLAGKSDRR